MCVRDLLVGLVAFACVLSAIASPPLQEPRPWMSLWIALPNYALTISPAVAEKGDRPQVYSQTGTYLWTGGRYEALAVTFARDPAFAQKYALEALRKSATPPKELEVGKKKAYLWELKPD